MKIGSYKVRKGAHIKVVHVSTVMPQFLKEGMSFLPEELMRRSTETLVNGVNRYTFSFRQNGLEYHVYGSDMVTILADK